MGNRGVKDEKISWKHIAVAGGIGILLFYGNGWLLGMNVATTLRAALIRQRCWRDSSECWRPGYGAAVC